MTPHDLDMTMLVVAIVGGFLGTAGINAAQTSGIRDEIRANRDEIRSTNARLDTLFLLVAGKKSEQSQHLSRRRNRVSLYVPTAHHRSRGDI